MRGTWPSRVALLLVVSVLVAVAGWQWRRQHERQAGHLLTLRPAQVTRIDLRVGGGPWTHYVRRAGRWRHRRGSAPVDDGQVEALARAAAIPVLHWRAAADFEPARIGLSPPSIELVLNGRALAFGATSAVGPQRYVRVGSRIALVPLIDTPRVRPSSTLRETMPSPPSAASSPG